MGRRVVRVTVTAWPAIAQQFLGDARRRMVRRVEQCCASQGYVAVGPVEVWKEAGAYKARVDATPRDEYTAAVDSGLQQLEQIANGETT